MSLHRRKARPASKPFKKGQREKGKPALDAFVEPRPGCPRPDKRHFRTSHDALNSRSLGSVYSDGDMLGSYRCPCGLWALTSQASR